MISRRGAQTLCGFAVRSLGRRYVMQSCESLMNHDNAYDEDVYINRKTPG